jgi:hypothetical protein
MLVSLDFSTSSQLLLPRDDDKNNRKGNRDNPNIFPAGLANV